MSEPITPEQRRWKSTLIERDRYREALWRNHEALGGIIADERETLPPRVRELLSSISNDLWVTWKFRQHSCPKCGEPCDFTFAMIMVGPHSCRWDCPMCGVIRNSRESGGGKRNELIVESTGEVVRLGDEREPT